MPNVLVELSAPIQCDPAIDETGNPAGPPNVNFSVEPVSQPPILVVELSTPIKGDPGADGINGTNGDHTYPFAQSSPAAVWNIAHGLNRYPSVSVIDSAGEQIDGDVRYVDANTITVTFAAPFSGDAYLN